MLYALLILIGSNAGTSYDTGSRFETLDGCSRAAGELMTKYREDVAALEAEAREAMNTLGVRVSFNPKYPTSKWVAEAWLSAMEISLKQKDVNVIFEMRLLDPEFEEELAIHFDGLKVGEDYTEDVIERITRIQLLLEEHGIATPDVDSVEREVLAAMQVLTVDRGGNHAEIYTQCVPINLR